MLPVDYSDRLLVKDITTFSAKGRRERGSADGVCCCAREKLESASKLERDSKRKSFINSSNRKN